MKSLNLIKIIIYIITGFIKKTTAYGAVHPRSKLTPRQYATHTQSQKSSCVPTRDRQIFGGSFSLKVPRANQCLTTFANLPFHII